MILKWGSSSNSKQAVRALSVLVGSEMTDKFTLKLRSQLKSWQKIVGIKADGVAGPETFTALVNVLPDVFYKDYSGSIYVKAVQALVSSKIDGQYGDNTRSNVLAFQAVSGLEQTGNVMRQDWLALFDLPYTKVTTPMTHTKTTTGTNTKQPVDYKQADKRWGSKSYTSTNNKKQTIANSGCGPTSMADIMATWIDKTITPVEMCSYSLKHGYRTASSGTAWGFFKSISKSYGFSGFVQTKSMATVREALKNGGLAVSSMGPGYWTKGGHYICLWRSDESYMYANDPASSKRKKQTLKKFEKERKQFFIFYKPGK